METRRAFIKKTLAGTVLLAAASAVPLALRKTRLAAPGSGPKRTLRFFTPAEYAVFAALAERILATAPGDPTRPEFPGGAPTVLPEVAAQVGGYLPGPPATAVDVAGKADAFLAPLDAGSAKELKQLLGLFDNALFSLLTGGPATPFTQQTPVQQDRHLAAWANSRLAVRRTGYQALKRLACAMYYASPETYASVGYPGPPAELVRAVNEARTHAAGAAGADPGAAGSAGAGAAGADQTVPR